jgi:hypothetical protein
LLAGNEATCCPGELLFWINSLTQVRTLVAQVSRRLTHRSTNRSLSHRALHPLLDHPDLLHLPDDVSPLLVRTQRSLFNTTLGRLDTRTLESEDGVAVLDTVRRPRLRAAFA